MAAQLAGHRASQAGTELTHHLRSFIADAPGSTNRLAGSASPWPTHAGYDPSFEGHPSLFHPLATVLRELLTGVALTLSPSTPNPAQQRPAQPRDDEQPRPNVLFLIAEDLTAEALSCYGNRQFMTPSIDRLAGLAVPEHVEGRSLLRVLATPTRA